jgi:hypothetical protein
MGQVTQANHHGRNEIDPADQNKEKNKLRSCENNTTQTYDKIGMKSTNEDHKFALYKLSKI